MPADIERQLPGFARALDRDAPMIAVDEVVHRDAVAIAMDPPPPSSRRSRSTWQALGTAAALVAVVVAGLLALTRTRDEAPLPAVTLPRPTSAPQSTVPQPTTTPSTVQASPSDSAVVLRAPNGVATVSGSTIFEATPIAPDAGWVVTDRLLAATDAAGVVRSSVGLPSIEGDLGSGVQAFIDADHAVVARPDNSSGGVVVIGTDDRLTTSFTTDIEAGFARSQPIGLAFADPLHGWLTVADADSEQAAGSRGALYRTVDGGRSFDRISDDAPAPLAFVDEQTGWATGSGLYLTRDSGATWTQLFPPNWDAEGPAPGGPWYTVEAIDSTHAVVRQQAPTGMQAQVRYYATDDLGTTWRDVTPPGTSEVSNTGPQTWLAPSSDTHIVGLTEQMDPLPAATWLTSSDGGETYSATQLRFAGVGVSMLDQQTGWIRTPTELWSTSDSGNTWTQLAIAIAPFDTEPGCTWQPELAGSEGAGGTFLNWFSIRNLADRPCDWPTVIAVTASSLLDGTDVEITHGDDTIPLTNPIAVGASVQLTFYSSTTYMHCSDTQPDRSTPITAFRVEFENTTSSQLPIILEGTCTVGYSVTNQP